MGPYSSFHPSSNTFNAWGQGGTVGFKGGYMTGNNWVIEGQKGGVYRS